MKYLVLLVAGCLGLFASALPENAPENSPEKTALVGTVTETPGGQPVAGAQISALKNFEPAGTATTDAAGKFSLPLPPGIYEVEIRAGGHETRRVLGVPVADGQATTLNMALAASGESLDEVFVCNFGYGHGPGIHGAASMSLAEVTVAGKTLGVATTTDGARSKASAKPAPTDGGAAKMKGERRSPLFKKDEARAVDFGISDDAPAPMPGSPATPSPRAGLLTGGEWNDLHNWAKHWADMLADGEIDSHMDAYHFYPKHRVSVLLENENHFPAVDAEVRLLDKNNKLLWSARTDNTGRAELWAGLFDKKTEPEGLQLIAIVQDKWHTLGKAKPFAEGVNHHVLPFECRAPNTLDIVWAVDATGSMGDEIEYLKTELLDVIGRVKTANPDLGVRMGTVFYRDQTDEYLVRASGLNHDIARTVGFIRKQSANGGGDYPEAVHSALEEAIFRQSWSKDAVARICFLVLDASPHREPAVLESLQKSIAEAAKRGIRIVPLAASGIQKDTEFLMKFFGLATNGTYTFLTDHSGIGGKHLEPTADEYKVEAVNDMLVRIITEYATVKTCEGKSSIRFDDQQGGQNSQNPGWQAQYFPNPASDQFTLDLPVDVETLTIYNSEGQAVRKLTSLKAGQTRVPVADLPQGIYTLRLLKNNQWQSGKLVVARS